MTKQEKSKLKEQIFRLCEKKYRKGLQHGVYLVSNKYTTQDKIYKFRTDGMIEEYKICVDPVNRMRLNQDIIIMSELNMSDMSELRNFLELNI